MHDCGWLYIPRITNIKRKNKRRFRARPTLSKLKTYDGDEQLVDLRNDDVVLSGELRSRFRSFVLECQAKISRI